MGSRQKIWWTASLLGLAGAGVFFFLLQEHGIKDVMEAVAKARWWLLVVVGLHVFPLYFDALAWMVLFPRAEEKGSEGRRPGIWALSWMRWFGEAVGTLLPATQVGGDVVRARLAATDGVSLSMASATVVVDITVSIFSQILFTLTGLVLLAWVTGKSHIAVPAVVGGAVAAMAVGIFYVIQRFGIFGMISRLVGHITKSESWKPMGEKLDSDIRLLYSRPMGLAWSSFWTYASWMAGAVEVWVALVAVSPEHATLQNAIIMEAVGQGIRAAMFFIPGGLGFQEAGYVGIGAVLGIPPDIALALSLIRRVRELAFGLPGVLGWLGVEHRRAWRKRAGAESRTAMAADQVP